MESQVLPNHALRAFSPILPLGIAAVCLTACPRPSRAVPEAVGDEPVEFTANTTSQEVDLEIVGQMGGATLGVDVEGHYAYVGVGPRIWVVDVANPARPVKVGESAIMPAVVTGVDVAGTYAYVANADKGLRVIDVSTPTAPRRVGAVESLPGARVCTWRATTSTWRPVTTACG